MSNTVERRAGWKEKQREREKQGERGRAGEEQWKGREETTLSSDSSDWCRIKIVKTIYFCGLREIHRKQAIEARGWWVAGGGREWTEAEGRQNIITNNIDFPGTDRRGARRRESEIGLIKYRSEMVSPLHQGSLQAKTRFLCLISFTFRLWLQRRAGWEDQRESQWRESRGRTFFPVVINRENKRLSW